jgi:hypothetical protein
MLLNSTLYINLAASTYWSNNWGVLQFMINPVTFDKSDSLITNSILIPKISN